MLRLPYAHETSWADTSFSKRIAILAVLHLHIYEFCSRIFRNYTQDIVTSKKHVLDGIKMQKTKTSLVLISRPK